MRPPLAHPRSPRCAVVRSLRRYQTRSWRAFRDHELRALRSHRKAHQEGAADAVGVRSLRDFGAMLTNDAVADAQAQAGALADFLGGEKRIEDSLGMRDARAVVAKCDFDLSVAVRRGNLYFPRAPHFLNGIVRVVQNVQKHLLQLVRVADGERQPLFI